MPKHITSLDRIYIESPCDADWDSMRGNEQVRFCEHCNLSVHNLSEMTRREALRLVRNSNGRLCVRYVRHPEDKAKQVASPVQLYRVTRRASRLAAGTFTAILSVTATAAAQAPSPGDNSTASSVEVAVPNVEAGRDDGTTGLAATLIGTVKDQSGTVVAGATITLKHRITQAEQVTFSNSEGEYSFQSLTGGLYTIQAVAPGFDYPFEMPILFIPQGAERRFDVAMGTQITIVTAGGAMIVEPSSPLVAAAFRDDMDAVKELLSRGAVDVNEVDKDVDATALAEAVAHGNLEMVLTLIDTGADVNRRNSLGQTALMFLTENSNAAVARALIEAGARVNSKDEEGETALMGAARLEDSSILQALLIEKAKVNARSKTGRTALMNAAEQGVAANIRALIMAGADVNARDEEGRTALKKALDSDYPEIVRLLISFGAIEVLTPDNKSAKK
jgi:hypothetical protein